MSDALLVAEGLSVAFEGGVDALRGVDITLAHGESLAVVGESGAGKSTLALTLAGMVQPPHATGSVRIGGHELLGAAADQLRALRGPVVALAVQGTPFNPVATIGDQLTEPFLDHRGLGRAEARREAAEAASAVLLDLRLLDRYAHQLSGGERRRAALALTIALDPRLVVLDEPTAGLDTVTAAEIVARIRVLRADRGFALVVTSHDLASVRALAQRCVVLYAGEVVEQGASGPVLQEPQHPYSWALVNAYPLMSTTKDLRPIRGRPPDPRAIPSGCAYHPRCTQAELRCGIERPVLTSVQTNIASGQVAPRGTDGESGLDRSLACHLGGLRVLLSATGVTKRFGANASTVQALAGVDLWLREGEAVGVVGSSGSGKSTLARILTGALESDTGEVRLEGAPLAAGRWGSAERASRRRVQLVAQDPWDALSPRLAVADLVAESLAIAGAGREARHDPAVGEVLASVGLPSSGPFLEARTSELSGGQLQRIALARALLAGPKVLVADEPTALLDPSEQARVLLVVRERQVELGLGLILVSHDLALVRKFTDRIVVLDAGRVVEEGPSSDVGSQPRSAAGRRLIEAAASLSHGDADPASPSFVEKGRSTW